MELLDKVPIWAGNVPARILLFSLGTYVAIQWLKNKPIIEQQKINERLAIKTGYTDRIKRLEEKVDSNFKQCEQEKKELHEQIGALERELIGLRRQHNQEQMSLINEIISSVDAPELKTVLGS